MDNIRSSWLVRLLARSTVSLKIFYRNLFGYAYIRNSRLSKSVTYGAGCKFFSANLDGHVEVGRYTSIYGPNTQVLSKLSPICIGSYCSIASNVLIIEYSHDINRVSTYYFCQNIFNGDVQDDLISKGPIRIGNDVWIGTNSVILGGVTVGDGAVIAAGSVVNKDVPPFAIVAGNPAKVVRYRFSKERISELLGLSWWNWDRKTVLENKSFFF